jgi:hypothetical protein
VTKAETMTIINVTVINKGEGPSSNEFVISQSRQYSGLTIKTRNKVKAVAVRKT